MRRDEITRREASDILSALETVEWEIHPSGVLLSPAFELAAGLDRTVYDSVYLALAVAQNCALITADRKFHLAVKDSPFASHIAWVEDEV